MNRFLLPFLGLVLVLNTTLNAQTWEEVDKVLPRDSISLRVGVNTAIDGNYAVLSTALGESAYVFYFNGVTWQVQAELSASDMASEDFFGSSVSIWKNLIVIGARLDDEIPYDGGAAYIFIKPDSGWTNMTETTKLKASDGATIQWFGSSVSISSTNIVIGAPRDDGGTGVLGYSAGAAYVFSKLNSEWVETAKLTASDSDRNDYFGESVSISGDNIIVGTYRDDNDNGQNAGAAYVFTKPALGWSSMTETEKLTASDGDIGDYFGYSVDISDNDIVIGAFGDDESGDLSGSAYVFTKLNANWVETAKFTASDGNEDDQFGRAVSIDANNIIIGAIYDNVNGFESGSAYIYSKPNTGWSDMTENSKILASDGNSDDHFGESVSISGDNIIVGSHGENVAYFYHYSDPLMGIGSSIVANNFALYPNPVNSTLFMDDTQEFTIMNSFGQTVLIDSQGSVDVSSFAPGVYFVRSEDRMASFVKK